MNEAGNNGTGSRSKSSSSGNNASNGNQSKKSSKKTSNKDESSTSNGHNEGNGKSSPTIGGSSNSNSHDATSISVTSKKSKKDSSSSGKEKDDSIHNENEATPVSAAQLVKSLLNTVISTIPIILKILLFVVWATFVMGFGVIRGANARNIAMIRVKEGSNTLLKSLGDTPSNIARKILITIWCFIVLFAVLSLLGFKPTKYLFGERSKVVEIQKNIPAEDGVSYYCLYLRILYSMHSSYEPILI